MEKKAGRKGQLEISFGMIFSVLLVVIFIVVAFYVIRHFLELKDCTLVSQFYDDLQDNLDKVWKSQESNEAFSALLPSGITYVCFADMSKPERGGPEGVYQALRRNLAARHNVFLYPRRKACDLSSQEIEHLDLQNITKTENPYCVASDGKVKFRIEKGFYDALVRIK